MRTMCAIIAVTLLAAPAARAQIVPPPPPRPPQTGFDSEIAAAEQLSCATIQLDQAYQQYDATLSPSGKTALARQQRNWAARRNDLCTFRNRSGLYINFSCAVALTNARMAALQAQRAAPVAPVSYNGQYTVAGTAMPWLWTSTGLNSAFPYSRQDGSGPTQLKLSRLHAVCGQALNIRYLSGSVSVGGGNAPTDANGTTALSQFDNGGQGSTGQYLASQYITPLPIPLGELLGAFTDNDGALVSRPFIIGDGPATVKIPPEAANLQLGTNDDLYGDNSGAYTISVTVQR